MFQTYRNHAVDEWMRQLDAGVPSPNDFHHGARVYFRSALNTARVGSCVVCNAALIGSQADLCSGHWDYVLIPNSALETDETLVEYLQEKLALPHVEITSQSWILATKGSSRCEICDTPTNNVEELRAGRGHVLKRHVVCSDHQAFRWEE